MVKTSENIRYAIRYYFLVYAVCYKGFSVIYFFVRQEKNGNKSESYVNIIYEELIFREWVYLYILIFLSF